MTAKLNALFPGLAPERIEEVETFAQWLAFCMSRAKPAMEVKGLAHQSGVSPSMIYDCLRSVRTPSRKTVSKLAAALGVDAEPALRLAGRIGGPEPVSVVELLASESSDIPLELQQAMHYSRSLPPEAQKYLFTLWRDHARLQAELERKHQEELERVANS